MNLSESTILHIGDKDCGLVPMMATPTFGTFKEFDRDAESITTYLEHVDLYFTAISVDTTKQVTILLSAIGSSTYTLLSDLLIPNAPKDKSLTSSPPFKKRFGAKDRCDSGTVPLSQTKQGHGRVHC